MAATIDQPEMRVCLDPFISVAQWSGPEETVRELLTCARASLVTKRAAGQPKAGPTSCEPTFQPDHSTGAGHGPSSIDWREA
jgi:hypothetical protein